MKTISTIEPEKYRLITIAILTLQFVYGALFIFKSSVVVNNERYFILFDDVMISMKYAKTFAEGGGLRWFHGADSIQGYTNFLWTLFMSAIHLLPISISKLSLVIQSVGLAVILSTSLLSKKIYEILFGKSWASLAVLFLSGLYFPFFIWACLGLEAGVLTLLVTLVAYLYIVSVNSNEIDFWIFVVLAIGILIRIDFIIIASIAIFFIFISFFSNPAEKKKMLFGIAYIICTVLMLLTFQFFYYGDVLPNTFYLKLGTPLLQRISRGLKVTHLFLNNFSYIIFIGSIFMFYKKVLPVSLNRAKLFILSIITAVIMYNIYIGGDAWEWGANANRFVLVVMPLLFIVVCAALQTFTDFFNIKSVKIIVLIVFILSLRVNFGTLFAKEAFKKNFKVISLMDEMITRPNHDTGMLKAGLFINSIIKKKVKIAVSSAGISPYFIDNASFIDILGKMDRYIAKSLPHQKLEFLPGHTKWDLQYSIESLKPDIIIGNWDNLSQGLPKNLFIEIGGWPGAFIRKEILFTHIVPIKEMSKLYLKYFGQKIIIKKNGNNLEEQH